MKGTFVLYNYKSSPKPGALACSSGTALDKEELKKGKSTLTAEVDESCIRYVIVYVVNAINWIMYSFDATNKCSRERNDGLSTGSGKASNTVAEIIDYLSQTEQQGSEPPIVTINTEDVPPIPLTSFVNGKDDTGAHLSYMV